MPSAREFSKLVSEQCGESARAVERVLTAMSDMISEEIKQGRVVLVPGLGKFRSKKIPAKHYKDLKTKAMKRSPPKKVMSFVPLPRKKTI